MSELEGLVRTDDPLSILTLLMNLGVGVLLAALLRWHFVRFASTLSNRAEFALVFPFILLTTVLVISVVKSSLALSLGLVGALSIVRFRTPIKEPEELAYLFMAIAMGLGLGAFQTIPTVVSAVVILAVVAGFRWRNRNLEQKNLFLSVSAPASDGDERGSEFLTALNSVVSEHSTTSDVRRVDVSDDAVEVVYFLDLQSSGALSALIDEVRNRFPGVGVTFIDQNRLPSV